MPKRRRSEERGLTFVHPFDDDAVIAGQGTLGLELLEEVPAIEVVFVAIGGGGLASGHRRLRPVGCRGLRCKHWLRINGLDAHPARGDPSVTDQSRARLRPRHRRRTQRAGESSHDRSPRERTG
jgi:Pyridoxal-phosphate dependent enzyme